MAMGGGGRPTIDEQSGAVAGLDRHLGDALVGQLVVEVVEPHVAHQATGAARSAPACRDPDATRRWSHGEHHCTDDGPMPYDDGLRSTGEMSLFAVGAGRPALGSVLLIQEIFGVGPYITAVAERLAAAGYTVGAPDVFWRFAPNWASDHTEAGLGASIEKVQQLDFPQAVADCTAALAHLAELVRTPKHRR